MNDDSLPRIDLRLLRQFVAVAEELHFRRAAERLAMSQPPLTAAIQRLEEEIGATLVERGRKTVRLTPAGAVLLGEARRLLAAANDAVAATRDAAAGKRGRVRLGYVGSAMYGRLPEMIRSFRRDHPDVRIELREMTTVAQIAALRADDLDLAIVIPPLGDAGGLQTTRFDTDRLAIALPTSHPMANAPGAAIEKLAGEPFVSWPRDQGAGFHDLVTRLCAAVGFTPGVTQEAHGMHAVLSLVAVEAGIAIVPASMASIRPDEIAYRPIDGDAACFELLLCRRMGEPDPATGGLEAALQR
ncbi:LysR substrate-binding domain-containing protein [Kaistia sp. UC242_56]|uniref:LysR family transcriptional regulator n=1 Tax=Kaistia sp. UC242_56 TaxID=3374625 RepID=UPI0037B2FFBD